MSQPPEKFGHQCRTWGATEAFKVWLVTFAITRVVSPMTASASERSNRTRAEGALESFF
jgi:hypothetical protein